MSEPALLVAGSQARPSGTQTRPDRAHANARRLLRPPQPMGAAAAAGPEGHPTAFDRMLDELAAIYEPPFTPAAQSAVAALPRLVVGPKRSSRSAQGPSAEGGSGAAAPGGPATALTASACEGEQCSVCHDEYRPGTVVVELPCGHCYHDDCVLPWLSEVRRGKRFWVPALSTCPPPARRPPHTPCVAACAALAPLLMLAPGACRGCSTTRARCAAPACPRRLTRSAGQHALGASSARAASKEPTATPCQGRRCCILPPALPAPMCCSVARWCMEGMCCQQPATCTATPGRAHRVVSVVSTAPQGQPPGSMLPMVPFDIQDLVAAALRGWQPQQAAAGGAPPHDPPAAAAPGQGSAAPAAAAAAAGVGAAQAAAATGGAPPLELSAAQLQNQLQAIARGQQLQQQMSQAAARGQQLQQQIQQQAARGRHLQQQMAQQAARGQQLQQQMAQQAAHVQQLSREQQQLYRDVPLAGPQLQAPALAAAPQQQAAAVSAQQHSAPAVPGPGPGPAASAAAAASGVGGAPAAVATADASPALPGAHLLSAALIQQITPASIEGERLRRSPLEQQRERAPTAGAAAAAASSEATTQSASAAPPAPPQAHSPPAAMPAPAVPATAAMAPEKAAAAAAAPAAAACATAACPPGREQAAMQAAPPPGVLLRAPSSGSSSGGLSLPLPPSRPSDRRPPTPDRAARCAPWQPCIIGSHA